MTKRVYPDFLAAKRCASALDRVSVDSERATIQWLWERFVDARKRERESQIKHLREGLPAPKEEE